MTGNVLAAFAASGVLFVKVLLMSITIGLMLTGIILIAYRQNLLLILPGLISIGMFGVSGYDLILECIEHFNFIYGNHDPATLDLLLCDYIVLIISLVLSVCIVSGMRAGAVALAKNEKDKILSGFKTAFGKSARESLKLMKDMTKMTLEEED